MDERDSDQAAYMELTPDSWHQHENGNYAVDCPECGSVASLMNVVKHGRCNGFLKRQEEGADAGTDCTAKLWFELGYTDEPPESATGDGESEGGKPVTREGFQSEQEENVSDKHERPPGTEGTVDAEATDE